MRSAISMHFDHLSRRLAPLRELLRDRRGIAAIEFALIAPILLSLYFVTMEVSQGIEVNKKVSRIGSMVADLVAQQTSVKPDDLNAMMNIGSSLLQPYNRSQPTIIITGIQINNDANPKARVDWSRKLQNGTTGRGLARNTELTIPEQLLIPGAFLVRVESQLGYRPVITWTVDQKASLGLAAAFDNISMNEVYYLRPRMTNTIPCPDC